MSKVYFTADTHFNHANVIKYCARPFASIDEMNREMIARWNAVVGPEDMVYHLGDFAMGKPSEWLTFSGSLKQRTGWLPSRHLSRQLLGVEAVLSALRV